MGRYRIWLVSECMQLYGSERDLVMITLIPPATSGPRRPIAPKIRAQTDVRHTQTAIDPGRFPAGPIVGGLDRTSQQWAEHYQPHFHLIAPASARKAFETLRPLYPQTATGSAGLVIKPVTDLASGLSYCQKALFGRSECTSRMPSNGSGRRSVDWSLNRNWSG